MAAAALAILLPAVLPLSPLDGCVLLTAAAAVSTAAGDITSIVLGVPGEATAAAITASGGKAVAHSADVTDAAAVEQLITTTYRILPSI